MPSWCRGRIRLYIDDVVNLTNFRNFYALVFSFTTITTLQHDPTLHYRLRPRNHHHHRTTTIANTQPTPCGRHQVVTREQIRLYKDAVVHLSNRRHFYDQPGNVQGRKPRAFVSRVGSDASVRKSDTHIAHTEAHPHTHTHMHKHT